MQHNSYRRWITLAIISFSGGVSFDLAYLRYIYQIPMAKFMGFSGNDSNLLIVFYVQIMPDDFVMQLHRF